jgi:DNA-binding MarR family transcriptional regulator
MPKGKRANLYGIAPGPVPRRTKLPDGVKPYRPAAEWDAAKKAELDGWCDKIIEALSYHGTAEDRPPRFLKSLAAHTGLELDAVKTALERLTSLGLVTKRSNRYYLSDNKGRQTHQTPVQEDVPADMVPEVAPPPVPPVPVHDNATDLVAQAHALIDQLAQGNPAEIEQLSELRERNLHLESEVARLTRVVANLRAALSEMD